MESENPESAKSVENHDLLSELLKLIRFTGVLDSRRHVSFPWVIEGDAEEKRPS